MDIFDVQAGTSLALTIQLAGDLGQPLGYLSSIPVEAEVWPGGERPASFMVDASWLNAPAGQVSLLVSATQTLTLATGRYLGRLILMDPDEGPILAYEWAMNIQAVPGLEVAPATYCGLADLQTYARGWLDTLQGEADEAGFALQRGRARAWLDDLILQRYPNYIYQLIPTDPGYISSRLLLGGWETPNLYVRSLLDANLLIPRLWVIEATARYTLALICENQVGFGENADQFQKMGRLYRAQALSLATASVAEIASPAVVNPLDLTAPTNPQGGNGVPLFSIRLSSTVLR